MLFHNIMPFIALIVSQSATQIPAAVKGGKTADTENDTHMKKKNKKKKHRHPRQNPKWTVFINSLI